MISLAVVDADDPASAAAEVGKRYQDTTFDSVHDWPVRMAVIRHRDALTHMVVMYSQLATDQHGLDAMMADLAHFDDATPPPPALQPLELARSQQSPAGQRVSAGALRYWERLLRTVPARRFGVSDDPRVPRYQEIGYRSRAAHLAAQVVAARTGVDTSAVLLAAFAIGLWRVTGISPVVTQLLISNRFRPRLADVVGSLTQAGLCVLDVAEVPFDEVVRRARRGTVSAGKNAYYDLRKRDQLVTELGRERGEEIDISCFFNDRRTQNRAPATGLPTEAEIRAAVPNDEERFIRHVERRTRKLFCHINDVPDTVDIMIRADTHHLAPADISRCLRHMATTIVEASLQGAGQQATGEESL